MKAGQYQINGEKKMAKNDTLEPFKNANIEMYFDDSSKKWNAELKLRNEETIEFSFNASENDLSDFWYGFNYNGKEYDMNICNGGDYGNGGWIYPVDNEGHVDTSISEQLDSVNIYSRNRNNIQFWIWKDYDDLSGHLVAPDGKSYFSYDWTTKEYKVTPDSGWDSFLDADPTRDTSLTAFKEYAQKFIKENIVRDSDIKIIFEREYIDTEILLEEEEKRMAKSETLADKYNRMEKLFEDKLSHLGSGDGETFKVLCKWVEEEFPEKDSEGVLLEATSRMIEENLDFGVFNYQAFDDVYGFGDGAEWRLDFSDSAAKELLSGEIVTLSDAQSLIWEKAEKEFAALKENPLYKDEIEITDRINSAFRIADFLYPEFTKEIDKEKNLLPDEWPQYSNEEKKTVINNAFEKIKSAFDEKKVRLSDSRTDELVFEGSDKRLLLGDFKALIKGKDAAKHGKESLSYIRPNKEQLHDGIENGWEFDEITTGYAIFQNPDLDVKGGFTPKFISKLDDMNVFESDGDAAKQYGIDHNCQMLEEKKDIWIGDENLEYYSYPDIPENRRIMKENGWLLEQPLEFDFPEFTEKDFNRIRDELFKDNPKEDYYGRLHIGSLHVEFVINQNDGWVDTNYYILGEKGEGETQFGVPYGHFPGHQFIANLFTDNTYEEFKEKVSAAVLDDIAEETSLKPEAMRPLVDWNDEEQVKELYRTKLVESARNDEITILPYTRDKRSMEVIREFIADIEKVPANAILDDMVTAVIDNIGNESCYILARADGTNEWWDSEHNATETGPAEIMNQINSWAEEHAANSEENSIQKKDYVIVNSLYEKTKENSPVLEEKSYSETTTIIKEQLEKISGITVDKSIANEIYSRYHDHDLTLRPENNGSFRYIDDIDGKYVNPFSIAEALEQTLVWNEKELSELHAGTADDEMIAKIKNINEELEHIGNQIACTEQLTNLDFNNKEHAQKVKEMLGKDFNVSEEEAKVLLTYATHFDDGTHEYGLNKEGQLYFKTNQDNEGWSFLTEDSMQSDFLTSAFDGAAILLDSDRPNDVILFNSFLQKNENLINELDDNILYKASLKDLKEKLKELNMAPISQLSFIDDEEKMKDFPNISKEDFLSSYSYLSEEEYEATLEDFNKLNQKAVESRFSDTIKTIEDINKVYDRNKDFIERNISFRYSNPEYNEIDEIEKWKKGELYIPVADRNGNFTNDMEANTLEDYNLYANKNFKSYSEVVEYQAGLKAKLLDSAIEHCVTEYMRREYVETSPNPDTVKFEITVENQSYPIDEDGLKYITNKNEWGSVEDRLNEIIDKRFEEEIEQTENDLVSDVLEYIAQETNGNLVLKNNEISDVLFSDELVQIYAPKEEFLAIQPEETKTALIEAGIAKEELYSNVETMTVSENVRDEMLSASFAGQGGLTQKAFADNGIEIDLETANALENCFSQIEAITKYTADGHDLFSKGNGIDTISEHSIEYSEETKSWFIHEKNWIALSAIKGDKAGPDDYMEKADRVGDRNWSIGCELLVKYVYQEIKEDGEMEKEFPETFKKLENLKDYTESLTEAKQLISDFCFDEYMSTPTFDDLKDVGLAYTTFDDPYTHEEHEIQTSADLVNCKIITKVNDKIADVIEFEDLKDMVVNSLNNLDFDSLIYLPTSIKDEVLKEEREEMEKHLLEKAEQIIKEAFDEPSFARRAKLYIPSDYGYDFDNKIHILVEFDNEAEREDDLFNALAEKHFTLPDGTEVDFNPIKPENSGTIEQYLESLERIHENLNRFQKRKEDILENVIVSKDNFREVFNEISKLPKFKDKPLEAAGWCFARVPKENREEVGKWLATLNGPKKKDVNNLFDKWNKENNPKPITNKSKTNEKDDWSISD